MTEAYVTLVATDAYASGALVLSHKLRSLGSQKEIVCLVTPNITVRVKEILSTVSVVIPVDTIRSTDFDNLELLGRPELDITFTKLHLWRLTQYSKIVFLDADTYPLKNIDELFNWPSFSAAPDAGWPDCFNSGVFVTEPSEAIFNELTALASEKGSFDGGDQGLLNSYFSSWSTTPFQRLPFTFNTTPTAQYGYAPAHNQYGHNISILHFIGQNKPWKYQRFTDGRILPLGGSAWEGLRDMVQAWWNTWDEHYGRMPPYHLLSGEFDHFDSGFQTHPIVPFDEPVKNAWEDQKINFHDERRHIQPMPPISNISIKHAEWIKDCDIQEEHVPYNQTQPESQPSEQHNQGHHHEHHNQEHHEGERDGEQSDNFIQQNEHQSHGEESHHHDHHQEQYQHQAVEQNNSHTDDQHSSNEAHAKEESNQDHEKHHKQEKTYSMIEWNPAYQDPPKTGNLGADIPDLSSFKNVWDQPHVQQHHRLWVAPVHRPEPDIMKRPEYANYDTGDYDSEILYPREIQNVVQEQQTEEHKEEGVHHVKENREESLDHDKKEHPHVEHHHVEHHHQEPIYPPAFPWDNVPNHFPSPTRVWLDEQSYQQSAETPSFDHHSEQQQQQQEDQSKAEPELERTDSHEYLMHEESQKNEEPNIHNENQGLDVKFQKDTQHKEHIQSHPDLHITIDYHSEKTAGTEAIVESTAKVELETEHIPVYAEPEQDTWQNRNNEQALFAIDQALTPSAQIKINEFIATLAADDTDGLDYSDRDLIPINFKSSSRLQSGIYTPSPAGSRIVSRNGSRNNSRSNSRRASIVSSRRNSFTAVKKPVAVVEVASSVTVEQDLEQSSKLFAAESSIYSRKTPYTSAAVTPAAIATPEELDRDTYFNDDPVDVEQIEGEELEKPDFLEPTQYSLSDSLELEGEAEIDDWDPMKALNKLREHSESMVLRQSLHEALIKTARDQERESEFLELASEPVITQPKRPTAFKSSWDDEEYELPSGIVSGQSSPRTPIVRSLSSNLTAEIEMEKERHKQQRASLMLAQPQAAVASMLEAELDLSEGTLFKRRHYESSDTGTEPISSPPETIETFVDDEYNVEDKSAFFDISVVKEAQRKLMALIAGENDKENAEALQADPIPIPITKEMKQALPKTTLVSTESSQSEKPTASFADYMLNRRSHFSNFGLEETYISPIYKSKYVEKNSSEKIEPLDIRKNMVKDSEDEELQVKAEIENSKIEEEFEDNRAAVAAIALLSGVEESSSATDTNEKSISNMIDEYLDQNPIVQQIVSHSDSDSLAIDRPPLDSGLSVNDKNSFKESSTSKSTKQVMAEDTSATSQSIVRESSEIADAENEPKILNDDKSSTEGEFSTSITPTAVAIDAALDEPSLMAQSSSFESEEIVPTKDIVTSSCNDQAISKKDYAEPISVEVVIPTIIAARASSDILKSSPLESSEDGLIKKVDPGDSNDVVKQVGNIATEERKPSVCNEDKAAEQLDTNALKHRLDIATEGDATPSNKVSTLQGSSANEDSPSKVEGTIIAEKFDTKASTPAVLPTNEHYFDKVEGNVTTEQFNTKASTVQVSSTNEASADKVEDNIIADASIIDKSANGDRVLQEPTKHDATQPSDDTIDSTPKLLPNEQCEAAASAQEKISSPDSSEDVEPSVAHKNISGVKSKGVPEKHVSNEQTPTDSKATKDSNEAAKVERKQGSLKKTGSIASRTKVDVKGKEESSKASKAREVVETEKSVPDTKTNTNKHFLTTKTISKRSSDPVLKPLPSKPVVTNVKTAKAPIKAAAEIKTASSQKSSTPAPHTLNTPNTKTLRNRTSAPVLQLSQDSLVSPKTNTAQGRTSKPGTPTKATFSTRSATPPSPPPKTTGQGRATTPNKQTTSAKSSTPRMPTSPVKTNFSAAKTPSPVKSTFPTAKQPSPVKSTFQTARQPSPVKPTFQSTARHPSPVKSTFQTTVRQPSPTKATFASKAAFAIKSVTGNKPLTPSRKDLPPRASTGPSKTSGKRTSPILPVRSNSKSTIATPVTSATSVVSEEPIVTKPLPDAPLKLSDESMLSKRKNSKKGKERISPTSSVISIPKTTKPKPDTVTSPKAHLVDHHHSSKEHNLKAISKQSSIVSAHKDTYASVTKSRVVHGERHMIDPASEHHHHQHEHTTAKDQASEQKSKTSETKTKLTDSVLSLQSTTSSSSYIINETSSIASVASSSTKSLSFTRRGSSSSSIIATNVTTATGTISPTASTSSSRKSARERISSFVKGSAFKKNKKIPEEK